MKKYGALLSYGFVVALALLSIMASQSVGKRSQYEAKMQESPISPPERVEDLKIVNKTSAFRITEIKKVSDNLFEVTYKNKYGKGITGFEVSVGSMRVQTELILGGNDQQFIPPGGVYLKTYTTQEGLDKYGLQILAVMFDDGGGDGDAKYIKEITDYRLGMKIERERVLPLLEQLLTLKTQNISTALEGLENKLSSTIPPIQQNSKLDNVGIGIRNERWRILQEIKNLKNKQQQVLSNHQQVNQFKEDLNMIKEVSIGIITLASQSLRPQRDQ